MADILYQNMLRLPGEILNQLANDIMEVPWPESEPGSYKWVLSPLPIHLILSEDLNIRSAVRRALSKKIFISFRVEQCIKRSQTTLKPLFLLPRIIADDDFQELRHLNDEPPSNIRISINIGCDGSNCACDEARETARTVFILDELTTTLFVCTMYRKPLCWWRRLRVICDIHHPTAATITEGFLDFMLRVIPARRSERIKISGHPNIRGPTWVLERFEFYPTYQQDIAKIDKKLAQVEKLAERKVFLHQIWTKTANNIIKDSLDNCLSCMLTFCERVKQQYDGPFDTSVDLLLRLRTRSCTLYFKGLLNSLTRSRYIHLAETRFLRRHNTIYCMHPGAEFWDPYTAAPNDLAMAIWITNDFLAQIHRIPTSQTALLQSIFTAVKTRAALMAAITQVCCCEGDINDGKAFQVRDLWWADSNVDNILDPEDNLVAEDFYLLAKDDHAWCERNWQYADMSVRENQEWHAAWKDFIFPRMRRLLGIQRKENDSSETL